MMRFVSSLAWRLGFMNFGYQAMVAGSSGDYRAAVLAGASAAGMWFFELQTRKVVG